MRCRYPRTVGFRHDGKTIAWSQKEYSREFATFPLPCRKCLECRLEDARQWAVRASHEAMMHDDSCFITLTYSDENLSSPRLQYGDFQSFVKKLRSRIFSDLLNSLFPNLPQKEQRSLWNKLPKERRKELYEPKKISVFGTGEYGSATQRPHFHALIFGWSPSDRTYHRTTERGDRVDKSKTLDSLWGKNDPETRPSEIGEVTFESAGYCARYAAKKLVHGRDQDHDFHPVSKKSSHQAIGKRWLEKFWRDCFNFGNIILPDGRPIGSIPRYYEKWLKKHQPEAWYEYVTQTKSKKIELAALASDRERDQYSRDESERRLQQVHDLRSFRPTITRAESRSQILDQKFKQLQKNLKL